MNEFNAQQAQKNRDYQTEMSNTAYQRGVADMQAAGLNPALMFGNGNAASSPSGNMAEGSASVASPMGIADAVAAYATMKNVQADVDLKRSQQHLNEARADESQVNAGKIVEETQNIVQQRKIADKQIEGLDLDNKQKEILLEFTRESEQAKLDNLKLDQDVKKKTLDKMDEEIAKLSEEKQKIAQETRNLVEQVNLMLSQETLNYSQASQAAAMVGQINQNIEILKKDNANYDWNHLKTINTVGGQQVAVGANGATFSGYSAIRYDRKNARKERKKAKKEGQW